MVLPARLSEIIHFRFAGDCEADSKGVMPESYISVRWMFTITSWSKIFNFADP